MDMHRVLSVGQKLAGEVEQLEAAGAAKIFRESASGVKADRLQLRHALAGLELGDVFMVTRLDRIARSTRDLLNTLGTIVDRGADFRSLGEAWADTTTPHGRLMVTLLSGIAEFRKTFDLGADPGRPRTGRRKWGEARPQTDFDPSPAAGSAAPAGGWP